MNLDGIDETDLLSGSPRSARTPMNIVDVVAVLPFFVILALSNVGKAIGAPQRGVEIGGMLFFFRKTATILVSSSFYHFACLFFAFYI